MTSISLEQVPSGGLFNLDNRLSSTVALEAVADPVIVVGPEGEITWANQHIETFLGYTQEEAIGQNVEMLLPKRFRRHHPDFRKSYYANPSVRPMGAGMDLFARHKNGTEVPCEIRLSPLETANGSFVVCGLVDISKRKHARNPLLESERLLSEQYAELELLYRTASLGLCHMDTDLRYLQCNEKLAEINGIPSTSHIGRTLREIVPDIAETMEPVYRGVIESGQPAIDVVASMKMDIDPHKLRHFSACYYPLKSEQGVVRGVSSIVQEITEQVEAEESLREAHDQLEKRVRDRTMELEQVNVSLQKEIIERKKKHQALMESEQRFRLLLESTNAIPWECDAKTWLFTYVGPQAHRILGYPVSQWYERDFWVAHIHPEDREYAIDFCQTSSQGLKEYAFDYRMVAADGRIVWLHDIVSVVHANGVPETLHGFMIDISDRKNAEEHLQKAEAEASLHRERLAHIVRVQTLGEMAAGIAHEINQPLAAIDSYTQACKRYVRRKNANLGKVKELITKVGEQAKRAGSVVARLRALLQRRTVDPVPTDVSELLMEAVKIAEIDARLHDCDIELKLDSSLPHVTVDGIQIQQVVINLIRNGLDAMENMDESAEKVITLDARCIGDNELEIRVSDRGCGLAELGTSDVFEPFYSTKPSGMGMGLPISRNIIDAHGGEMGYSQNQFGGLTFYFSLPIVQNES